MFYFSVLLLCQGDEKRAGSLGRERVSSVSDEYLRSGHAHLDTPQLLDTPTFRRTFMCSFFSRFLGKPGHVEKRFPVDRKKLERLIVGMYIYIVCV